MMMKNLKNFEYQDILFSMKTICFHCRHSIVNEDMLQYTNLLELKATEKVSKSLELLFIINCILNIEYFHH